LVRMRTSRARAGAVNIADGVFHRFRRRFVQAFRRRKGWILFIPYAPMVPSAPLAALLCGVPKAPLRRPEEDDEGESGLGLGAFRRDGARVRVLRRRLGPKQDSQT